MLAGSVTDPDPLVVTSPVVEVFVLVPMKATEETAPPAALVGR